MQNLVLFDISENRQQLLPLTYTRPVSEFLTGILTLRQRWETLLRITSSTYTEPYLQTKYPLVLKEQNIVIASHIKPSNDLASYIQSQNQPNTIYYSQGEWVWAQIAETDWEAFINRDFDRFKAVSLDILIEKLMACWQVFNTCEADLKSDFKLLTAGRQSLPLPDGNRLIGPSDLLFIEEGAVINNATLNTTAGPIYIDKDAEIMEGSLIRGPFSLGCHAQVKMGTKIYGATSLGPYVKVGGELNNVVIFGYSSKAHDGFLGNAVIGEWCNLGADTNNSNLKNNYDTVKVWNYVSDRFENTGLQFCGLIMADHSKSGINTMFNTGTVVGVSANIFGPGFPRNFIPSFAWGGSHGFSTYQFEMATATAKRVLERRGLMFDETENAILREVFERSAKYRENFK